MPQDVTKICFVPNRHDVKGDFLIVNFFMLMLGYAYLKTAKENMIGLSTRMVLNLDVKGSALVSIIFSLCFISQFLHSYR